MSVILTPQHIYDHLDKKVVGQEDAKKALAQAGFLHASKKWHHILNSHLERPMKSSNALIMGPSGCGKTYLVQALCEFLGTPMLEINARSLTQEGYKGMNVSDYFETFVDEHGEVPGAVVFFDEFDKICGAGRDWEVGLQYTLLKIVEGGGVYIGGDGRKKVKVETHDMLFIFGGNYAAIRENIRRPKRGIGYKQEKPPELNIHQELIRVGLIQELAGRISILTEVKDLTRKELRTALLNPNGGPLSQYQELYEEVYNEELELSNYHINKILDICEAKKIGARGLFAAVDEYLRDDIYKRCTLDEEHLMGYLKN